MQAPDTQVKLYHFSLSFNQTTMKDLERPISEHIEATRQQKDWIGMKVQQNKNITGIQERNDADLEQTDSSRGGKY